MTATLHSEVEMNKDLICIDDILFYTDASNCQKWIVTELFDEGFSAKDDYETRDFYFRDIQHGWSIAEATKINHEYFDRAKYI